MTKSQKLKQLDVKKSFLLKEVDLLCSKLDISEPMSKEEKYLVAKIANIFSKINSIILEKRKLR